jgi:ribulose-phosphate 3-epimerase
MSQRARPAAGNLIAPSILSADFGRLAEEIRAVEAGGAGMIHVDVMDGHFVPNLTIGPPVVASLRRATRLPLDCHLMIEEPDRYVEAFLQAGADMISVHQEASVHLHRTLTAIRAGGALAGVVLNPATPVATIFDVLGETDYVLLMSVNPGFGGQKFIPGVIPKLRELRARIVAGGHAARIQVDGGVGASNIQSLVAAGAEWFVAGNAIYGSGDATAATRELARLAARP